MLVDLLNELTASTGCDKGKSCASPVSINNSEGDFSDMDEVWDGTGEEGTMNML